MTNEYKVHYLLDADDMNWKTYKSENDVNVGDIIELASGYYHVVINIHEQKTQTRIDVSESADSKDLAVLLARQQGLIN